MRFRLHGSSSLIGIQIDWTVPVERGPELRAAMGEHDVDQMQAGVLRRGYTAKSTLYERGTIALRIAEGHEIFLQAPAGDVAAKPATPVAIVTSATVEPGATSDRHRILVGDREAGERIDVIIAGAVPTLSRAVVQRLIDDGQVTVGGQPVRKNRRPRAGDVIELEHARLAPP